MEWHRFPFQSALLYTALVGGSDSIFDAILADLNGDGRLDITLGQTILLQESAV